MENKKKLLIFIDWYKPGYKAGGPIRSISNLISNLSEIFDIYVITRNTDYLETTPYTNIQTDHWNNIDNASVYYISKKRLNLSNIKKLIIEINPSIIYCNSLYSPFFSLFPIHVAKKLKIHSIIAVRGMLSKGSLNIKAKKKKIFLWLIKKFGLFKKCVFHATTIEEKKNIQYFFGNKIQIIVAQNLSEQKSIPFLEKDKKPNHLKLVSIGRIAPEKNTLFALEVLKKSKSYISFDIYGPIYNHEYWNKCLNVIKNLPSNIVVKYKGVLPHDQLNYILKKYHSFFLPSTGENFGHSIIEAMSNSCIPIISDKTPWKNLSEKKVGFDLPLDRIDLLVEKIDFIASMNNDDFNKMSYNSYLYAQKIIFNKEVLKSYYKLFQLSS